MIGRIILYEYSVDIGDVKLIKVVFLLCFISIVRWRKKGGLVNERIRGDKRIKFFLVFFDCFSLEEKW